MRNARDPPARPRRRRSRSGRGRSPGRHAPTPVELSHATATREYLTSAPESPFIVAPTVTVATDPGHQRLTTDALVDVEAGAERETPVEPDARLDVLEREFGVRYGSVSGPGGRRSAGPPR
jgi:hypothetical protein